MVGQYFKKDEVKKTRMTTATIVKSRRGRKPLTFGGFLPFDQAKQFVRALGLKSVKEWNEWCQGDSRPEDIPSAPGLVYRNEGWVGMPDFCGYEAPKRGRPLGSKNKNVVAVESTDPTPFNHAPETAVTAEEERTIKNLVTEIVVSEPTLTNV